MVLELKKTYYYPAPVYCLEAAMHSYIRHLKKQSIPAQVCVIFTMVSRFYAALRQPPPPRHRGLKQHGHFIRRAQLLTTCVFRCFPQEALWGYTPTVWSPTSRIRPSCCPRETRPTLPWWRRWRSTGWRRRTPRTTASPGYDTLSSTPPFIFEQHLIHQSTNQNHHVCSVPELNYFFRKTWLSEYACFFRYSQAQQMLSPIKYAYLITSPYPLWFDMQQIQKGVFCRPLPAS